MTIAIRDAQAGDLEAIVSFNLQLAWETEHKRLDRNVLTRGVVLALADPGRLRYWVADAAGRVVGQTAVTREWSDWRGGWLWWLQSVYVAPEHRGQGVFRALYGQVRASALTETDVIGLRLYVELENDQAQRTYQALGMAPGGYQVYEELWPDRFNPQPG
jgi:GNAT superfamily N-acetyltransferase